MTEPDRRNLLGELKPVLDESDLTRLIERAGRVHVSDAVLDYIQDLVQATRDEPALKAGLSPRAMLALLRSARAHAMVRNQDFVLPDNVKQIFPALASHRLQCLPNAGEVKDVVDRILAQTRVP